MICTKFNRKLALFCTAAALATGAAHAQSSTQGAIAGTVEDPTSAAIPKAAVTIHNNGTNAEQQLTADDSGYFKAPLLEPGTYTVTVKVSGFSSYRATAVTVQVGQLTTLEPHLIAGSTEQVVDVSADTPVLNFESPDFSSSISHTAIDNIPVNNRRWSALAMTTPGVVSDSNGYGLVSIRGISPLLNNIEIDGADDNQAYYSEERGRTREAYSTSENAVREFQVNSGVFAAEFGRAAGGVINSVTKSGTNQIHGDAYFFDRESNWAAFTPDVYQFTSTSNGAGGLSFTKVPFKPENVRKIWGFSAGGPLMKDRLFWFYTYDQHHLVEPAIAAPSSPGTFFTQPDSALPSNQACNTSTGTITVNGTGTASAIDGQACALAARTGLTSYASGAAAYNNGLASLLPDLGIVPRVGDQEINTPKLDWQVNQKEHVSFLFHRLRWDSPGGVQTSATAPYSIDAFGNDFVKLDYGVAKLTSLITSSISNELLYQYGRELNDESQQPYSAYTQKYLVGTGGNVPQISLASGFGGFTLGSPYYSYRKALPDERKWQIADTVYLTRGNHSFKFGVDTVHNYDLINNTYESNGAYSYTYIGNYFADIANEGKASTCNSAASPTGTNATTTNGKPVAAVPAVGTNPCYASITQGFGNPVYAISTFDYGVFAQDNWKVSPRLTLQIGVRYDYEFLPSPSANLIAPVSSAAGASIFTPYSGLSNHPSDKNNIGPRVGFSYDVYGSGNTVLRGGYGMYYGRTLNGVLLNTLLNTGSPNGQYTSQVKSSAAGAPTFPNIYAVTAAGTPVASLTAPTPSSYYLAPNLQNPMVQEFDLQLQQQLGKGTFFQVSYLGALGRELPNFLDINLNPATQKTVNITVVDTTGKGPLTSGTVLAVPTYTSYINPNFQSITEVISNINSSYHGLVAEIQNHSFKSIQFDANYTWSHALDFNQNQTSTTTGNNWLDPYANPRSNYGNSSFNVPQRFVGYALYKFPNLQTGTWIKYLSNDWQFDDTFQMQSGLPFSAAVSSYNSSSAVLTGWNGSGTTSYIPNVGRNTYKFNRDIVDDIRLEKGIPFGERYKLRLIAQVFNIANHQNTSTVNSTAYTLASTGTSGVTGTATYQSNFGTVATTNASGFLYTPRQVEISAKFSF